jgi:hypothetical protein
MNTDLTPLIEVLEVVKPYLADIVLVGGWVPIVYAECTSIYRTKTMGTGDVDLACPHPLDVKGEAVDHLLTGAGFQCELSGDTKIPYCKYVKGQELEIEFLTPLKGDGSTEVEKLQEGLMAEALRYLDVLLAHTDTVEIDEDLVVRVPLISAFLFQKGLSFPERRSQLKLDKDLYYIFKVVETVDREYLMSELNEVLGCHPGKWRRKFDQNLRKAFGDEHSYGVIAVVKQLAEIPEEQGDRDVLSMRVLTAMEDFLVNLTTLAA